MADMTKVANGWLPAPQALIEDAQHARQLAQKTIVVSIIHKEILEKQEGLLNHLENKLSHRK
jgi:hypothetical protein